MLTFAKRTAMARAKKGQLKDVPVDELMQALIKVGGSQHSNLLCLALRLIFPHQASLEQSKLDPAKLEDICVGVSSRYILTLGR